MAKLKRSLNLLEVTSIGLANIIGAGVFVLSGVAAGIAGPSVIISFLVAGFIALLTAFSSAELSSFISKTGGSYIFTKEAFGDFWAFLVGWFVYFDEIVSAAAVSVSAAAYFNALLGLSSHQTLLIASVAFPFFFTLLNLIGIKETGETATLMVFIKTFALILLIALGINYLTSNFSIEKFSPFFPNGISGMLNGAAIVFFAFLGFNTVCMVSEETKNPKQTIPKALLIAFFVSFLLYVSIAFIEVGVADWRSIGKVGDPLSVVAKIVSKNNILFTSFISFSALVAISSVILSSIIRGSRIAFAMGRDKLLPKTFAHVNEKFRTPDFSIIFEGIIVIILAGAFYNNLDFLASVVNFGSLFTYLFIHLSLLKLRKKEPKTGFKTVYPWFPLIGAISCILLMFYLSENAKIAAAIWGIIGLALYLLIRKRK